ncbi:MAG: hypothetical protein IPN76_17375 [Saprospiraceae bacterium]|nr:hypothetical protein [Saprospiraceae bacterium]
MQNTTRILNCSTSLENYYLCIEEKVTGFTRRGAQSGDLIFLASGARSCSAALASPLMRSPTANADSELTVYIAKKKALAFARAFRFCGGSRT